MEQYNIGLEIKILSNLIKRKVFFSMPSPPEDGLTSMQAQIIDYLYNQCPIQPVFQKDVEEKFSIRRSTASRILRTLEDKKVITRESVSHDARLKKVCLTKEAIAHHQLIKSKINELETLLRNGLTDEEIQTFFTITSKIKENLNQK